MQGLLLALPYKATVNRYWREKGELPDSDASTSLQKTLSVDMSQSLTSAIELGSEDPGVITLTFMNKKTIHVNADIDGKKMVL